MARTFKVLSLLLCYPEEELRQAVPELRAALASEGLVGQPGLAALDRLLDDLATTDLMELQERYVFLFDRTRSLSLHLFEHIHGESRDRGQAMVDLLDLYDRHGLELDARELPDFLPLLLEFLAILPLPEARELLRQPLHVVTALRERLEKRGSIYAAVFGALEVIAEGHAEAEQLALVRQQPDDDPDDLAALDAVWEEEAVTFTNNAGAGSCGVDRLRTLARASARKASA